MRTLKKKNHYIHYGIFSKYNKYRFTTKLTPLEKCQEEKKILNDKLKNLEQHKLTELEQTKNESGKYTYIDGDGNFVTPLKAGKRRTRRTRNTRRKRKTF